MPTVLIEKVVLDLTRVGAWKDVPVSGVEQVTAAVLDPETWGAGVVEVRKVVGGAAVAFDPAVEVSGSAPAAECARARDAEALRLVVTAAGEGFGRIALNGKETQ